MKVAVIGGGGREHAIIKALKKSPEITELYCIPGNGGILRDAVCINIPATEVERIAQFCAEYEMDYVVVAPDDPLSLGLVDLLREKGIPAFGPDKKAAVIESSKAFSKEMMKKYGIPTARYEIFSELDAALQYLESADFPIVVKADGLALGKGVVIAEDLREAREAVLSMMRDKKFGKSGEKVVIEEFLTGPEVSVLAFTDGKSMKPMVSSMDHKRAGDNDTGLNTGGMGTVAPNPCYTAEVAERCMKEIFLPTMHAMNAEGRTFKGCLYFGLMITKDGPKVIEYNCRFGDPETQVVLPLLESDLFTIMRAVTEERLSEVNVRFSDRYAACVVMASKGYPLAYEKGFELTIPAEELPDVYIAGAKVEQGRLVTSGGRVLGVTKTAGSLKEALQLAYDAVGRISFENAYYRKDIGKRALEA
ncbi:MAG: phosphoribosylamine--glycine ligase [Lachnospiraceae bacterium]|nr:phosphoribosylamine--glycine ligase [Lachnospiraceae bacterium]